ncbi:transmembrane emp24 domain-containing protein 3 isoform X1 [Saimiri boliviensis]|uniref:transmembrane emp24 domain-containing protein 3 isoform X1 n=1 Tax=Saimiri boliviensis TaxID=27679 RepID=UPI003D77F08E
MGRAAPRSASALLLLLLLLRAERPRGAELTFELPDNAKQCFHEEVEQGVKFSLDYQVITGGHYDVDCYVEDPQGNPIYRETKKQYDSFTHRAEVKGVYQFCFSNEFSTFSHKTVYFDFQVGDEPPILPDMGNRVTALTQNFVPGSQRLSRQYLPEKSSLLRTVPLRKYCAHSSLLTFLSSAWTWKDGEQIRTASSPPRGPAALNKELAAHFLVSPWTRSRNRCKQTRFKVQTNL